MKQTYNGWTNYETWLVNLWYGDFFSGYVQERQAELEEDETISVGEYADYLEEIVRDDLPMDGNTDMLKSGLVQDLLNATLAKVNWYELAEHALEG